MEVPSELHVMVAKAANKGNGKRIHINSCKAFPHAEINSVAVSACKYQEVD